MLGGLGLVAVQAGLLDAFDKVIRRHVRAVAAGFDAFLGPGEMAVFAIIILFEQTDVGSDAHG